MGFTIHGTDNIQETKDNLRVLGLFNKYYKRKKFNTINEVFRALNKTERLKWLVLRNFDKMPNQIQIDEHLDIDLLVNDYYLVKTVLDSESLKEGFGCAEKNSFENGGYRVLNTVSISNNEVLFDFRFLGDNYYDIKFQKELLSSRVKRNNFYIPEKQNYLYSLLYHALIHKKRVSKTYIKTFDSFKTLQNKEINQLKELLDEFYKKRGYSYVKPLDESVIFNYKTINNTEEKKLKFIKSSINRIDFTDYCSEVYFLEDESVLKKATKPICENENRSLKRLNRYDFFPKITEFKKDDQIIIEKINGFNFIMVHEESSFWTKNNIIDIYLDAIDILIAMHKEGVIHRDITPHNLIVECIKNSYKLKLIDFGWSTYFNENNPITPNGLGSSYKYKEGEFSDIYSMGMSLCHFNILRSFKIINDHLLKFSPDNYEYPQETIVKLKIIRKKVLNIKKRFLLKDELYFFAKRKKLSSRIKKSFPYKILLKLKSKLFV